MDKPTVIPMKEAEVWKLCQNYVALRQSHGELVEALKKIADPVEGHDDGCGCNCCDGPKNIALKALAAAQKLEGGPPP